MELIVYPFPTVLMDLQESVNRVNPGVQVRTDPLDGFVDVGVFPAQIRAVEDRLVMHDAIPQDADVVESLVDVVEGCSGTEREGR